MTIELRGVNTHNKGAHLMMIAVSRALKGGHKLSVSPNGATYEKRAELGYRQTTVLNQAVTLSSSVGDLIPRKIREMFGLAARKDITAVLDAAGFAYSDSFSAERAKREYKFVASLKKRGAKYIMLPQAFGPFTNPEQREWSRRLLLEADVVYARDRVSLGYVQELDAGIKVERAPDFTVGLDTSRVESGIEGDYAAIVPNQKMLSHAGLSEQAYVDELVEAGNAFVRHGLRPVIVIHEFNDRAIGRQVAERLGCEIFEHDDPIVLKRTLGAAKAAIASRFHAIVGALSAATPVLAYGWSHKYEELLTDFDAPSWMLRPGSDVAAAVDSLFDDQVGPVTQKVAEQAASIKQANADLWADIERLLERGR